MINYRSLSDNIGNTVTVRGVRIDINYLDVKLISVDKDGVLIHDGPLTVYVLKENIQSVEMLT